MKLFVWDFHGVLEKGTEDSVLEISNQVLATYGYSERLTAAENHDLFGRKWFQYFEYLLPAEPHPRHIELQEAAFEVSDTRPDIIAKYARPNDHATTVLDAIAAAGHDQILISNTKPGSLKNFLRIVGMAKYFTGGRAFAMDLHRPAATWTKQHALAGYLRERPELAGHIVIVGDSAADMALAEVAGGTRYLYAQPGRPFKATPADYRIHDLRDVLMAL